MESVVSMRHPGRGLVAGEMCVGGPKVPIMDAYGHPPGSRTGKCVGGTEKRESGPLNDAQGHHEPDWYQTRLLGRVPRVREKTSYRERKPKCGGR